MYIQYPGKWKIKMCILLTIVTHRAKQAKIWAFWWSIYSTLGALLFAASRSF